MATLEGRKLTVGYDKEDILHEVEVSIPQGRVTAIIGPNGCGKSTMLKALARINPLRGGTVLLDGKDISILSSKQVAQKMAILPQSPVAPSGLTVEELVAYGRYPHQGGFGNLGNEDKAKIGWALELTKLTAFRERDVDALSGGQRQRVWIAMALAQDTELMLLDEPTTYLDLVHQLEVLQLLAKLNAETGRTIALVIHEINMAARFADHIIALRAGQIVACGTPKQIIQAEVLRAVFDIDAIVTEDPRTGRPVCLTYDVVQE